MGGACAGTCSQDPEGAFLRESLKFVGPIGGEGPVDGLSLSGQGQARWWRGLLMGCGLLQGAELTSKMMSCHGAWSAAFAESGASEDLGHCLVCVRLWTGSLRVTLPSVGC